MKKIFGLFLLTAVTLLAFSDIAAQARKVSEEEFVTLQNKALEKLKAKNYRMRVKTESYRSVNDPAPSFFSTAVMEFTPAGFRSVNETRDEKGVMQTEIINLGARRFIKLGAADWKEITSTENGAGGENEKAPLDESETAIEYKFLGREVINNQNVYLYELKITIEDQPKDSTTVNTQRLWFDKDGSLVKRESENRQKQKVVSRSVYEYEYDANIRIAAPIK